MQGFNMGRYVPPELEGTVSANIASGKGHALGSRARKPGILTVRFECPFAIWCTHCKPEQIIGQGVRFNAEKKKVGMYHSTPMWSFRMKHSVCGGWIEIRTEPREAEYVVVEGGRRRDYGDVGLDGGLDLKLKAATEEERERVERDGGFSGVERRVDDKRKLMSEGERLEELRKRRERDWEDPYEMSKRLRRGFRVERKEREELGRKGEALREKLSLGIELLEEREEDALRARFVEFGGGEESGVKPMFGSGEGSTSKSRQNDGRKRGKKISQAEVALQRKNSLRNRLAGNTKNSIDPFLKEEQVWQPKIRRKQTEKVEEMDTKQTTGSMVLVDYDSESS